MLICLSDLFACSGLTQTCKLLTNFSKNSFYLLPEPLRRGYFLTNYCYNIAKAKFVIDPELFKKLDDTDIWEFRTFYNKVKYRLLAFWDKDNGTNTLVIATHGFIKKTQKTPPKEIAKAEDIRKAYFNSKK